MWAIIATWRMALEGVERAADLLSQGHKAGPALEEAIRMIEDFPYYKSVGYGGLPNQLMELELDAGFMDGNDLSFGAVGAIQDFKNPICLARRLAKEPMNNFLVGAGAERLGRLEGFERTNMLTDRAKIHYHNRCVDDQGTTIPYRGHDTVGVVVLDQEGSIVSGTSTSGLFMKKPGRLGDSPIIGAGFYADSQVGGVATTGLGEDLMKGCISYEIVRLMEEGKTVQEACDQAVWALYHKLVERRGQAGDLSVVALDKEGHVGCSTTIDNFSFVVASQQEKAKVYLAKKTGNYTTTFEEPSKEWLDNYLASRMAPLERK